LGAVTAAKQSGGIGPPAPLLAEHRVEDFHCGVEELDAWLKQRALKNQQSGVSRTFVICKDMRVIGYYSLASAQLHRAIALAKLRRNMPEEIPAALIGRLAVDRTYQGRGLGADLVFDAVRHIAGAADHLGVRLILIHAISEAACAFYEKLGVERSPVERWTLMTTVADALAALEGR
jgi:GNAT superfamily N-acetyltransferase